jgi:subtilisin family serine protease
LLIRRSVAIAIALAIFAAAAAEDSSLAAGPPIADDYVPGEVLLVERPDAPAQAIAASVPGAVEVQRAPSLRLRRLKLPPGVSVPAAVQRFSALRWVEAAEPNYRTHADVTPADPLYSFQAWYYNVVQAPAAWDLGTGDPGVVVAVVDSGIDLTHPDLNDNLWTNSLEIANGIDDDGNTIVDDRFGASFISAPSSGCGIPAAGNPDDDSGHGTAVAGVLGAETNNPASGVAGTAWDVSLMAVKALDCNAVGTVADAAMAVSYAAAHGAQIINMSLTLAIPRNGGGACLPPVEPSTLAFAIEQAQQTYGVTIIAAAGNDGCPYVAYPAASEEVIAVGASAGSGAPNVKASFSNWGTAIDLAAPGVGICSTGWSPSSGASYTCGLDGTSFASPMAAGLAALMLAQDPALTFDQIRSVLETTALNLPDNGATNWDGHGRINMRVAIEAVSFHAFVPGLARD